MKRKKWKSEEKKKSIIITIIVSLFKTKQTA